MRLLLFPAPRLPRPISHGPRDFSSGANARGARRTTDLLASGTCSSWARLPGLPAWPCVGRAMQPMPAPSPPAGLAGRTRAKQEWLESAAELRTWDQWNLGRDASRLWRSWILQHRPDQCYPAASAPGDEQTPRVGRRVPPRPGRRWSPGFGYATSLAAAVKGLFASPPCASTSAPATPTLITSAAAAVQSRPEPGSRR